MVEREVVGRARARWNQGPHHRSLRALASESSLSPRYRPQRRPRPDPLFFTTQGGAERRTGSADPHGPDRDAADGVAALPLGEMAAALGLALPTAQGGSVQGGPVQGGGTSGPGGPVAVSDTLRETTALQAARVVELEKTLDAVLEATLGLVELVTNGDDKHGVLTIGPSDPRLDTRQGGAASEREAALRLARQRRDARMRGQTNKRRKGGLGGRSR